MCLEKLKQTLKLVRRARAEEGTSFGVEPHALPRFSDNLILSKWLEGQRAKG
jgi:hypothetical protein